MSEERALTGLGGNLWIIVLLIVVLFLFGLGPLDADA